MRLAGNSLVNMIGRAGSLAFWVLLTPYLLHRLGSERFGLWSLVFMFTTYMLLMDLGAGPSLARFAAEFKALGRLPELGRYVATTNTFYLGLGASSFLVAVALGPGLLHVLRIAPSIHEAHAALVLCTLVGAATMLAAVMNGLLVGFQRFLQVNTLSLALLVPSGLGIWLVLGAGQGLLGVLWVQAGVAALGALAGAALVRRSAPGLVLRPLGWEVEAARQMFQLGIWAQLFSLVSVIQLQVDKLFLARWAGLATVTSFELGFRVSNGILALPGLAYGAITPAAVELAALGDQVRLHALHVRGTRWAAGLTAPLVAGTWVAGPWLLRGWLAATPPGAELALRMIAASLSINLLSGTGSAIVWAEARPQLGFYCAAAGLLLHVVLSLVLVPAFGLPGALFAQLAAMAAWVGLFTFEFHRRHHWSWTGDVGAAIVRPVVVGAAAVLGLGLVARTLPAPVALGRWAALGLAGQFNAADVQVLRQLATAWLPRRAPRGAGTGGPAAG
ncbi:MAG TPA: polysaccharide biosynthesis C-terminal domain-containing protein [Candidatus Saccharimonadales bacterium]|nr:polysaccharide biosynthesis C-terminal domain-containing protein [Candidatus Saccharimonadales bacterium]